MTHLSLFDPDPGQTAVASALSVSELTAKIKAALEVEFFDQVIRGEVSNVARPRSGHLYFKLKDDQASLEAVIWRSLAQRLVFDLEDGLEVEARGDIEVYPPQGRYQLVVRSITPRGVGALELAFRQMFERLKDEGLFDPQRKRPLPRFPRKIAIVTSPSGAAVRDLVQVISRRWRGCDLIIVPTRVQGAGAAEEIAEAIALANRLGDADLIITGRGGGSLEDLWAFNEEVVARAIFHSRLPVVTAVGHEVDVTIADFVADRRALTPSEAGELSVPDAAQIRQALVQQRGRSEQAIAHRVLGARQRLGTLRERLDRAGRTHLEEARTRLDRLAHRARHAIVLGLEQKRARLLASAARLEAMSPVAVLTRGYSITQTEAGRVVRSRKDVQPGERLVTRLPDGVVTSRVEHP